MLHPKSGTGRAALLAAVLLAVSACETARGPADGPPAPPGPPSVPSSEGMAGMEGETEDVRQP